NVTDYTAVNQPAYGTDPCQSYALSLDLTTGACNHRTATASVNLTGGYPERVWCKTAKDDINNCRTALQSGVYTYPDSTYSVVQVRFGAPYYYKATVQWCSVVETNGIQRNYGKSNCQARKTATYKYVNFSNWVRVDLKPTTIFPLKGINRTDCAGATCTYAEEMNNFATWFAWYRTRMQMTKSAIGLSFSDIRGTPKTGAALTADPTDGDYLHARVGLTNINAPYTVVNVANFDQTQKDLFYTKLYAANPQGGTPLRSTLIKVGRMYAGDTTTFTDPIQYSCQRNFTIMATDGYWSNETINGIGNPDGAATRPSLDTTGTSNTLADIAYYYYHTDLRTTCTTPDKCTNNVPPSGTDVAVDDIAQHQHMTTFTISLGVDGTLVYDPNYKLSTSGDYYNIRQGGTNWPAPAYNTETTIDDLWHTAVNGRGQYFSTRDPSALEEGLQKALSSIDRATGSGAAAATSNLQPTSSENAIFIATYRTVKWDGEMTAYAIDLSNGNILPTPVWQAEALLRAKIGGAGDTDTRVIYTTDGTSRTQFKIGAGGLTAAQAALFDNSKLNQYADWSAAQKLAATPALMVDALRGQDRFEDQDRPATFGTYQRLYRDREKVLGDIVHSQPVFVKKPPHNFSDAGYSDFKAANLNRLANLYAAGNDGMLHAFDAATGQERWAFVPPAAMPEMWRILDGNYESNHRFFLDGPLTVSDAKINGVWKTVLIGAMGKGGRGFYALDVTDPVDPKPLWSFTADNNPNVGYSYGVPFMAKLRDGTWVAVVTSGYNNTPEGLKYPTADGKGYVFVLNVATGAVIKTIPTNVGSASDPSGLARLNLQVTNFDIDDTASAAYGGDLTGNMYAFDLEAGTATKLVSFGPNKPITTTPEIGDIEGMKMLYFGTGRYLGETDLTNTAVQSFYGIKIDKSVILTDNSKLVQQVLTSGETTRTVTNNTVDYTLKNGWFMNLPDTGERVNIDPQLFIGTVIFATTVPTASACQPGGYSWINQISYKTGGQLNKGVVPSGQKSTSPAVGLTVSAPPGGTPSVYVVRADGKLPTRTDLESEPEGNSTTVRRVLWRELFD
ncbi:MAG TPA: PilC/PilY family type IV pilus protein, partial [Telluria sp.]